LKKTSAIDNYILSVNGTIDDSSPPEMSISSFVDPAGFSLTAGEYQNKISYTGILADNYCLELPGTIAIDGANLTSSPEKHSVHCLRDIMACKMGYSLMVNNGTSLDPNYIVKYRLDSLSNDMVIYILKKTTAMNNYILTVIGAIDNSSPPIMSLASFVDPAGFSLTVEEYTNSLGGNGTISYTGILADNYCLEQPGTIAIDGTNMTRSPEKHSVHCLRDIPACLKGYSLMVNIGTSTDPNYIVKYQLDSLSNDMVLSILKKTTSKDNYVLTVTGTIDNSSPPIISLASLVDPAGFSLTSEEFQKNRNLAIGLGLGIGLPFVILVGVGIYYYKMKNYESE